MRIITLCLLLAIVATTQAQITIGLNEMPAAGDQLTHTRANLSPFINYGATGANFTWNFNNLTAAGQETRDYQSIVFTNLAFTFIFADIFINPNRASHATAGTDIPFNDLLGFEDTYTFFYRSNAVYRKVGFGVEAFGVPLPITMDQQDVIYQLPLIFGNTSSSFSQWSVTVPTLAYYGYEQQRNNEVDGWGTITTPAGTFDALRVKTTLDGRDSILTDLVGLGFAIDRPLVTEYKWLANGIRVPVLQINTVELFGAEIVTDIFFYDEPRSIAVAQPLTNSLCPGATVTVNYEKTGVFNSGGFLQAGNIFRAQLSDANGSFATPVNIGSVTSTQSGTINATIPAGTAPGTGYRIRVISTNPNFTGTDNGFDITIGEAPTALALATDGTGLCEGGTVLLTANTGTNLNYQWHIDGVDIPEADGPELLADATGTFTVAVSNACGNAVSNGVEVTVDPLPTHALNAPSIDICAGGTGILGAENISGVAVVDYQWDLDGDPIAGATASSLLVDGPGTYGVTVTNPATGCIFFIAATVDVENMPTPLAFASGFTDLCDGDVIGLVAVASGAASYQWYLNGNVLIGADQSGYDASVPGTFTVATISSNGCISAQSAGINVSVEAIPLVPEIGALAPTTFCAGGSVELAVAQEPGTDLQWFLNGAAIAGAEGTDLFADASGTYTVVATNNAGCFTTSDAVEVTVLPVPAAPELSADGTTTFCEGGSVQLIAEGVAGATFQWSLDDNAISGGEAGTLTATADGSYTVAAVNAEGCATDASDAVVLVVNAMPATPAVDITGATNFCQGGFVALEASSDPGVAFQWSLDGEELVWAVEALLEAEETGSWTVTATNDAGCTSTSEAIEVIAVAIPADPTISANGATSFCDGTDVTLVADAVGVAYTWLLDGSEIVGTNDQELTVTSAGSYSLVVTVDPGCSSDVSNTIDVELFSAPATPELTRNVDTLFATGSGSFQWLLNGNPIPGATDDQLVVTENGDYAVEITDANGCSTLSAVFPFNSVGLDAAQASGMRVYPNPNEGAFKLELDRTTDTYFTIHDATGKLVKQGAITGPVTQMELREGAGLYFLQIVQAGVPSTHRIVVGH